MGRNLIKNTDDLKKTLAGEYQKQIVNYFGDQKKALKFLSSVVASAQRTPALLECEPTTLINSFIKMAELNLMPSDVSGEAYVIPYKNNKKGITEAQFQLGYQGLVTLFYRAGVKSIISEIVYSKDKFSYVNGKITHEPDVFADDRGEAVGAYVIIETQQGGQVAKVMKKKDILAIGKRFSKSFSSSYSPWNSKNDPERWMWKKTVLKQASKLVPKDETLFKAIDADNRGDSTIKRLNLAKQKSAGLKMGKLIKQANEKAK